MIQRLEDVSDGANLQADLVIVGGGACGLTLARELSGSGLRIILLESGGLEETDAHEALNTVISAAPIWSDAEQASRTEFHGGLTEKWTGERQVFGVRCRGLGGSTRAWAGKSAAFDPIDYEARDWVEASGWPMTHEDMAPFIDRAANILNLGPNTYGEDFWALPGQTAPEPQIDPAAFSSFFWQFSRGRVNPLDTMRFAEEYQAAPTADVSVLLNATVTRVLTRDNGRTLGGFEAITLEKKRVTIAAPYGVLAASAIENARILLASNDACPTGVGNRNGLVGRYLTDHLMTPIGWLDAKRAKDVMKRFGFYGIRHGGRSHMYAHGLQLSADRQRDEKLLNGAIFFMEERTPDDPFSAMARLAKNRSKSPWRDVGLILRQPVSVATGVSLRILEHHRMPDAIRRFVTEQVVQLMPNKAAREYRFRGLPHKLKGVRVYGICEQAPDADNRVTLDERTDALGQPMARIEWCRGEQGGHTMLRLGQLLMESFERSGLPVPDAPDWLTAGDPTAAPIIDVAHTMGTTRMSTDPAKGVVDTNCKLHDVDGLYAMGGSVMPTTGHANPTLMMLALTVRLADHLKATIMARRADLKPASPVESTRAKRRKTSA